MRFCALLLIAILSSTVGVCHGSEPPSVPGPGKVFLYTAKKFGVPFLKASIRIENGASDQGKALCQIRAEVVSVSFGLFFRMNNRFKSIVEADTCIPIRYVKEIDQDGLFREKRNYLQTLTFDSRQQKVIVEKTGEKEKREVSLPPWTFDPLSMFARYYLKEALLPHQDIHMSIFDGMRMRKMVFRPKPERISSKLYGEVDTVCLESTTAFSSFEDREGSIRIWYTQDGKKIPLLMEFDLPVGSVRFELDAVQEG